MLGLHLSLCLTISVMNLKGAGYSDEPGQSKKKLSANGIPGILEC